MAALILGILATPARSTTLLASKLGTLVVVLSRAWAFLYTDFIFLSTTRGMHYLLRISASFPSFSLRTA